MNENQELSPLDGDLGPALRITAEQEDNMIESVLDQWSGTLPAVQRSWAWLKVAGYVFAAIIATSTASMAAWEYFYRPEPAPSPTRVLVPVADPPSSPPPVIAPIVQTPKQPEAPAVVPTPRRKVRSKAKRMTKAEDLLKQANALRRVQDWQRAARAYASVAQKFAGSDSDYVASVSEAEIQLNQLQNLARAKACYRRALKLRPSGVLEAEILFGLASVYREEADLEAEKKTLRVIVQQHGHSPFAALAKERLEQFQ
jgi:tetratricopeptide (TPR) repeat protein